MKTNKPDRDTLYRLYVEERKTLKDIGDIYGVTTSASHSWLKHYDIPRRSRKEQAVVKDRSHWCSEELLRKWYLVDKKSLKEIAAMFGVARGTVGNWAKCYGIEIRSGSEAALKQDVKPPKDELYNLYIIDEKTTIEIGNMFDVHKTTVSNWLHTYDIDTRIGAEWRTHINRPTDEELYDMYVGKGMTLGDIADTCGALGATTVCKWLADANISARTPSEIGLDGRYKPSDAELYTLYVDMGKSASEIGDMFGMDKGTVSRWIHIANIPTRSMSETKLCGKRRPSDEELYDMYITNQESTVEIGKKFDICSSAIARYLVSAGIDVRTNSEAHTGELSNAWKGGISVLPYCHLWTEDLRESIRDKFGRVCFLCGKTEKENGKKMSVHHVNYGKMGICAYPTDLVPLCMSCHAATNYDRAHWYSHIMCKLLLESSFQFVDIQLQI